MIAEERVAIQATAENLAELHQVLLRLWRTTEVARGFSPEEDWRDRFALAVAEIGANIVRHAHAGGTRPGRMRLLVRLYSDRAEAFFFDRGLPYRQQPSASPRAEDASDLPEGGFGLPLARAAVDLVEYSRSQGGTNRWRMVKRF